MIKKGFTFVELAIVLVIIGIIMGMAIKGKALIEVAKMRQDIRNIEKLEAAISGFVSATSPVGNIAAIVSKVNNPKYNNSDSQIDPQILIGRGFANANDLKISDGNLEWQLQMCMERIEHSAVIFLAQPPTNGANNICIRQNITKKLACNIEVMLDDQNLVMGPGRTRTLRDGSDFGAGAVGAYNCENVALGNVAGNIQESYYFMLW